MWATISNGRIVSVLREAFFSELDNGSFEAFIFTIGTDSMRLLMLYKSHLCVNHVYAKKKKKRKKKPTSFITLKRIIMHFYVHLRLMLIHLLHLRLTSHGRRCSSWFFPFICASNSWTRTQKLLVYKARARLKTGFCLKWNLNNWQSNTQIQTKTQRRNGITWKTRRQTDERRPNGCAGRRYRLTNWPTQPTNRRTASV